MRKIAFPLLLIGLLFATVTAPSEEYTKEALGVPIEISIEQQETKKEDGTEEIHGTVSRIIDADTIQVQLDHKSLVRDKKFIKGEELTVRFLLIDAPESVGDRAGMPYGQEASDYVKQLLTNKRVKLEFDSGDIQDHYDRYLAYVYVDGERVQDLLLENGYAVIQFVKEPNTRYLEQLERLEASAREQELGVWSIADFVQEGNWFNEDLTAEHASEEISITESLNFDYLSEKALPLANRGLKVLKELVDNAE